MAVLFSGAAEAAILTFEATVADLEDSGGALAALGADLTATEMVFRWSVSDTPAVISAPQTVNRGYVVDIQTIAYLSFSVTVGGVSVNNSAAPSPVDGILMRDGASEAANTTEDRYQVLSLADQVGPNGTTIETMDLSLSSADETTFGRTSSEPAFGGLGQPSLAEFNALEGRASLGSFAPTGRASLTGRSITVRQIEPSPVPLPAGAPMMMAGLGALGWLRRRRAAERSDADNRLM